MNDEPGTGRVLSSRLTLVLKLMAPILPLLTGALGVATVAYRPRVDAVIGMAFPFVVSVWICWMLVRLAWVSADTNGVEARVFWRKVRVPYTGITGLKSRSFLAMGIITLPRVTITVRMPDESKERFRFLARFTLKGWVHGKHPDVLFLREKSGIDY